MKKALLVLFNNRNISTFQSVYQSGCELKRRGVHVTILTNAPCDDAEIRDYFDEYVLVRLSYSLKMEIVYTTWYLTKNRFDIVIGYEANDAIALCLASFFSINTRFVYYNLEIFENIPFDPSETLLGKIRFWKSSFKFQIQKFLERLYCKKCTAIVIQDQIRAKLFKRLTISHGRTYLIPNSHYSHYSQDGGQLKKNFDKEVYKILYSGGLEVWSVRTLVQEVPRLKNIHLTISGWSRDGYIYPYKKSLSEMPNIRFLEKTFSCKEYLALVQEHDVGLVWYSPHSENMYYIGRSSGKFYMYLSCGKPVIVQNLPGLADDVSQYQVGVVIASLEELPEALEKIVSRYDFFCANARRACSYFDYQVVAKEFFDAIC